MTHTDNNENNLKLTKTKTVFDIEKVHEDMEIEALKRGDSKLAYCLNIFPIKLMVKNDLYKKRFNNNVYNELIIKNELAILYAKDGGNQWLIGERLAYIRDYKLHRKYGWSSFKEFIKEDLPYAVSTVYNYIDIYKRFTYEESMKAGSKLSLFTQSLESLGEENRKNLIDSFADSDVTYREAKRLSLIVNKDNILTDKEINEDIFYESGGEKISNDQSKVKKNTKMNDDDKASASKSINISIFSAKTTNGELILNEEQVNLIKDNNIKYQVILGFHNEYERRAINDILLNDYSIMNSLSKKVAKKIEEYKKQEKIS